MLDVAAGRGRHSAFFMSLGHPVTAVDRNTAALDPIAAAASGLEVIAADLEDGSPWPLPDRSFAGVIVCNYLYRPLMRQLIECLMPGGVLIYETFAEKVLTAASFDLRCDSSRITRSPHAGRLIKHPRLVELQPRVIFIF